MRFVNCHCELPHFMHFRIFLLAQSGSILLSGYFEWLLWRIILLFLQKHGTGAAASLYPANGDGRGALQQVLLIACHRLCEGIERNKVLLLHARKYGFVAGLALHAKF